MRHITRVTAVMVAIAFLTVSGGCISDREAKAIGEVFTGPLTLISGYFGVANLTYTTAVFQYKTGRWPKDYAELRHFVAESDEYLTLDKFSSVDFTNLPANRVEICFGVQGPVGQIYEFRFTLASNTPPQSIGDESSGSSRPSVYYIPATGTEAFELPLTNHIDDALMERGGLDLIYATRAFRRKTTRWPKDYEDLRHFVDQSDKYLLLGEYSSVDLTNLPADQVEICFVPTGATNKVELILSGNMPQPAPNRWSSWPTPAIFPGSVPMRR